MFQMHKAILTCLCLGLLLGDAHAQVGRAASSSSPPPKGDQAAQLDEKPGNGIGPGDKVHFFIEEDPVKGVGPIELMVSPSGDINFPVSRTSDVLISVDTRGKSLARIKEELKAKLDSEYYVNATVFLRVHQQVQKAGQVLFSGQVRSNVLPIAPGETVTLFEAMIKVGYSDFANLKKVKLNRRDPATQKMEQRTFDVDAMLKGDRSKDLPLQDGDHVEVPEKKIVGF
jgi:protein involved in polysaccharide export with SLBB domain